MVAAFAVGMALLGAPDSASAKIAKVSLFKNGYAMVLREIPVRAAGETLLDELPQSRLGTLWFSASKGMKVESIAAVQIPTEQKSYAASFEDVLSMNIGKEITVELINLPPMTGKLLRNDGNVFVMQDARGTSVVPKQEIRRVTIGGAAVTERVNQGSKRVLRIRTSGEPGTLTMMSFEYGITWTPAYAIDITDKKKLSLVAKATIANDIGDLEGIEARLVTGFPNVMFRAATDPLVGPGDVSTLLGQMGAAVRFDSSESSLLTQNAPAPSGGFGGGAGGRFRAGEGFAPEGPGGIQSEDLFFYRQPKVSLKRGERGYYLLFNAESDYEHVYTWSIPDSVVQDADYRGIPEGPGEVWHSLKFKNTSGQPLTTGTAVTMADGEILGQDLVSYTSPGAETTVRITKALDVRAEGSEEETARERAALKLYGGAAFDLVSIKGTLVIENSKSEKVKLEVSKEVTGDSVQADGGATISKSAKGLRSVNPRATIRWNPTIEAGKSIKLTYEYKVYVRQ